ncbi:hypothetical protein Rsub_11274 [Raphidocelis subcapitata]|uniref:Uncharacterized protein n=1 Tax=Raphidocelis subcapitata TaxID=307507 RepID=A0A2V0PNL5_9CHLO|nr:hypothetical protein Rsub_11274 [Raphidocelis subcapitata]|eukprot:GBF98725.1 hypothetical protein Rsub_11274 [Raphidocelis subcapitata]
MSVPMGQPCGACSCSGRGATARGSAWPAARRGQRSGGARAPAAYRQPMFSAFDTAPAASAPVDALQQRVEGLAASLGQQLPPLRAPQLQPPSEQALQEGLGKSLQLAQGVAGAVNDAFHAALAPFALFDGLWPNLLFWLVLALFSFNLIVLAPRQ